MRKISCITAFAALLGVGCSSTPSAEVSRRALESVLTGTSLPIRLVDFEQINGANGTSKSGLDTYTVVSNGMIEHLGSRDLFELSPSFAFDYRVGHFLSRLLPSDRYRSALHALKPGARIAVIGGEMTLSRTDRGWELLIPWNDEELLYGTFKNRYGPKPMEGYR